MTLSAATRFEQSIAKCQPLPKPQTSAQRLGARVRFLRLAFSLTQSQLAERAYMARPNLARFETGNTEPKLATILCLATALGVQPSMILCVLDEVP